MSRNAKTLTAGLVLIAVALLLPVILAISVLLRAGHTGQPSQFLMPGSVVVPVQETGKVYLWNDHKTIYQGKTYNESTSLPSGLQITINDPAGRPLAFHSNVSMSQRIGDRESNTVGYVEVTTPGDHEITVTGQMNPRVFSFKPSRILWMIGAAFTSICAAVVLGSLGVTLAIVGLIKMLNAKSSLRTT